MNKFDLAKQISIKMNIDKKQAEQFLSCFTQVFQESLENEEKIIIPGLGYMQLKYRKERTCKAPKSDKIVVVPAQNVPVFKIKKKFKDSFKQ